MTTYQVQYKITKADFDAVTPDSQGKFPGNVVLPDMVKTSPWGLWTVISEEHSLKSALNHAKTLVSKYGYEKVQICRSTKMNVTVDIES